MSLRAIYYDTETTGFKPDQDRIIEIAAFDPANNKSFECLVNPLIPIPPDATAIHHITDEMVKDAPKFHEVAQQFQDFCEGEVVLIAHNNDAFDYHFLKFSFEREGLELPSWKYLDTLKWSRRYRPDLPKHSLQFLREIYGIPPNNAHRALDDVKVLFEIFSIMIDDLTIEKVYELMHEPKLIQIMPFGKHRGQPLSSLPSNYVKWLTSSGALEKPENQALRNSFEKLRVLQSVKT